jgi:hypothetical protein
MTPSFQAQQALRLRHLHALQQAQAQASDTGHQGRYGDCVFRVPTRPPPPQPPRTGRLPGQRPAGPVDRAERTGTETDEAVEETGGEAASGEERIGADGMRVVDIDFDPDEDTGGEGEGRSGSGEGGEPGGGAGGSGAQPVEGRDGEHVMRHARHSHAHVPVSVAARPTRASGRRLASGAADNLSGGRDIEHDLEWGFLSTKDLEVKAILEATRVAAVDPDAQGKGGGGRHHPSSARSLGRARVDLPSCLDASPELASLRRAVLEAGTPQARVQALTHALFVLSATRSRPGPLSADAAQLAVMAAYLDAPNEPGPLSTRQGVKEALLMQGSPAASALPAGTPVRDRMALLPLKLLVCQQRRTAAQRQVATERMLAGMHWPVSLKGARREP